MEFEWDAEKDNANQQKHGIRFDVAATVFFDPTRLTFVDDREEYGEDRLITIGWVSERLCVVVYTETEDTIRIISARKANRQERNRYGES